eukprot:COSAG03_NODE_2395_length_2812_cov_2.315518_5_plen_62_part_00
MIAPQALSLSLPIPLSLTVCDSVCASVQVRRVLAHSKSALLKALSGNERVAKRLTGHVKEY